MIPSMAYRLFPLGKACGDTIASLNSQVFVILDKHTDLVSSAGILAITTCLLAAKIFDNIPIMLPRIAKVVYDFGGVIWLNIQVKDFLKSCIDFKGVIDGGEWSALIPAAAQIFIKATNIFMTAAIFAGSAIAAYGYPELMLSMAMSMRPLSMAAYFTGIGIDIFDYNKNASLVEKLGQCTDADSELIIDNFSEVIHAKNVQTSDTSVQNNIARSLVRQLDMQTIEMYKERPNGIVTKEELQQAILFKNTSTVANLGLIVLGYVTRGICKAYPNTFADMSVRWFMSALYTGKLVREKLFLYNHRTT